MNMRELLANFLSKITGKRFDKNINPLLYLCYSTVTCKVFIRGAQIQDKHFPVILLAKRQQSLDLKHLIPGNEPPELQG